VNWAQSVLVAIDQLGNAIAGGNPDATISARVGYFANKDTCSIKERCYKYYWQFLERVINVTFYLVDGPEHCLQEYQNDKEQKFKKGSDLMRLILSIIIITACPLIFVFLLILVTLIPSWRYKSKKEIGSGL